MSRKSELLAGRRLAAHLSKVEGTDYNVVPATTDPPDVYLVSPSGLATLDVEVVTAPIDEDTEGQLLREDRNDISKLEARLVDALSAAGLVDAHLRVSLQNGRRPGAVTKRDVHCIVGWSGECPSPGHSSLTDTEVYDYDADLSERVLRVAVYRDPESSGPGAALVLGGFVSRDGSWIRGAVMAKASKYAPKVAASLLLLVDAAMFVDDHEVDAFAAIARTLSLPFKAVWVVPRGGRVRRVWPPLAV